MKKNYIKKIVGYFIVIIFLIITPVTISYVFAGSMPPGNTLPCGCGHPNCTS